MATLTFNILSNTKLGFGLEKRNCKKGLTPEETFFNALDKLSKSQSEKWILIDFEQDCELFSVSKRLLIENKFDFKLTGSQ